MSYYKTDSGYVYTSGKMDAPEITKEEYDAVMQETEKRMEVQAAIYGSVQPLSSDEILRLDMRQRVNSLSIDNQTAGRMIDCFPTMKEVCAEGALIPAKTRIRDDNDSSVIWRNNVDLWNTTENSPINAPTLWDRIAYHDGIRIIPDTIPATMAWMNGELGWRDGHVYKSGMDGNVYLPGTVGAPWELML